MIRFLINIFKTKPKKVEVVELSFMHQIEREIRYISHKTRYLHEELKIHDKTNIVAWDCGVDPEKRYVDLVNEKLAFSYIRIEILKSMKNVIFN